MGGATAFARAVGVLGAIAFFGLFGEGSVGDWSAVYLRSSLDASAAAAAFGFGAFSVAMATSRALGDRIVARFGPRTTLTGGAALAAVSLAAALAIHAPWAAYFGFAGMGLGLANVIPVLFSAAGRMPGVPAGAAIAGVSTIGYIGLLAGPPTIGFVADATGLPLALALVVAFVCAIVALAFAAPVGDARAGAVSR